MNWLQGYRARQYVRNSIWVLPLPGIAAALILVRILYWIDDAMGWRSPFGPDTATVVLVSLAASVFTFIVFIASMLLLAVQLASAQLTPRIIGIVFRDRVTRLSLMLFAANFTFLIGALVRIEDAVPLLTAHVAAFGCLVSLIVFLYLIDHVGKSLRPSEVLQRAATSGRRIIEQVYPRRLAEWPDESPMPAEEPLGQPSRTIPSRRNGVLLAFDMGGVVQLARQAGCVIELVPQVGDFVAAEHPLFRIYGDGSGPSAAALYQSVAFGQERTLQQDPGFAFRIIVDIASKGLSPAINDPTTAVLAVDQIHRLLASVGSRNLSEGRARDASGAVRLIYRTPDWEDFVHLAVTEIRQFGRESIQVMRRLRAMLENLLLTLPERRRPLLRQELSLVQRSSRRFFPEPEDLALAEVSDAQGVGGKPAPSEKRVEAQPAPNGDASPSHAEAPR
jgi:uncharacterized membrane protein